MGMLRVAHTESSMNMGGQELRILQQIRWLLDHGHAAWLLAREDSAIYQEARRLGLPVRRVYFRGSLQPKAILTVLDFVGRKKIDIVDCHSSRDASTMIIPKLMGIPVVRSHHICQRLKDDFFHRMTWSIGCRHIIAASKSIANRIVDQKLGRREMIDIIGEGVDAGRFSPEVDGTSARKDFGVPDTAKLISVIGMIRPDKGQAFLIRAVDSIVDRIPDAYFFIVGSATRPGFLDQLKKEIDQIRWKERVILTGFQTEVEKFIAASDVIVLTSMIEAGSQVIPQAFSMKKIVVASNVGGIPEHIEHDKTGFLYPVGDTEALANQVVRAVLEDTDLIIENGYGIARTKMRFDDMMSMTLDVYRNAMGDRR